MDEALKQRTKAASARDARAAMKSRAKRAAMPRNQVHRPVREPLLEPSYNPGLTPLQNRWVDEFLITRKSRVACKRAGYSIREKSLDRQCSINLHNPKLMEEVERRDAARAERTKIDADWVIEKLADYVEFGEKETCPQGRAVGLDALKTLAKHHKVGIEKVEHNVDGKVTVMVRSVLDEPLEKS